MTILNTNEGRDKNYEWLARFPHAQEGMGSIAATAVFKNLLVSSILHDHPSKKNRLEKHIFSRPALFKKVKYRHRKLTTQRL